MTHKKTLQDLYTNSPAAFSTAARLYAEATRQGLDISMPQVENFLQSSLVATEFQRKYRLKRRQRRVIVPGPWLVHFGDLFFETKTYGFIGGLILLAQPFPLPPLA